MRPGPSLDRDAPAADVIAVVRAERLYEVLRRTPLAAAVNLVNGSATFWVFWLAQPAWPGPTCWAAALVATIAARLAVWRNGAMPIRRLEIGLVAGALASGLAWGLGAAFLLPDGAASRLVVAFVVGGMCAGAVTVSAAHFPTLAAFVLASCLPLAARFLAEGDNSSLVMGGMGLVFAGALLVTGWRFSLSYGDQARLQWQLNEANARLREEIAEHRGTEASLRESQKLEAIGRLTAGIAHDFNNLLMAINGQAEMIRRAGGSAPEIERRIEAIRGAVERGSRLIRQLLAFGRRQLLKPQTIDLGALLSDTVGLFDDTLGLGVEVTLRAQAGLWPVVADPGQIEHAILNLALNARDAMPARGTITIRLANVATPPAALARELRPGGYVEIAVADTGTGMPPDIRERAIEPFFTTKEAGRGSGLGLSQVYGITRQSGGGMLIDSAPGQGTTIRLFLPRAAPREGDAGGSRPPPRLRPGA